MWLGFFLCKYRVIYQECLRILEKWSSCCVGIEGFCSNTPKSFILRKIRNWNIRTPGSISAAAIIRVFPLQRTPKHAKSFTNLRDANGKVMVSTKLCFESARVSDISSEIDFGERKGALIDS